MEITRSSTSPAHFPLKENKTDLDKGVHKVAMSQLASVMPYLPSAQLIDMLRETFMRTSCQGTFLAYAKAIERQEKKEVLFAIDSEATVKAASLGNKDLLDREYKILNMPNRAGEFPFTAAVANSQTDVVDLLMLLGCDPYVERKDGATVLSLAKANHNLELFETLEKYVVEYRNKQLGSFLRHAIKEGDFDKAEALINRGSPIDQYDYMGENAFHKAAKMGDSRFVSLLMERGSNLINVGTVVTRSAPLHLAVELNHWDFAAKLVDQGACVTLLNRMKYTPNDLSSYSHHDHFPLEDSKDAGGLKRSFIAETSSEEEVLAKKQRKEERAISELDESGSGVPNSVEEASSDREEIELREPLSQAPSEDELAIAREQVEACSTNVSISSPLEVTVSVDSDSDAIEEGNCSYDLF